VIIAMAVTRDGIPVRCWTFPGNTGDQPIIRRIKDDLGAWNLRRLVWVADRGFASATNRAYSLHVQSAVDAPDLAGDVRGRICSQEVDDAGDLLRTAQPAHRDLRPDLVQHLVRDVLEHLGRHEAGSHRVHGDTDAVVELARPREDEGRLLRKSTDTPRSAGDQGDPAGQLLAGHGYGPAFGRRVQSAHRDASKGIVDRARASRWRV
jgi:hypothetical protein